MVTPLQFYPRNLLNGLATQATTVATTHPFHPTQNDATIHLSPSTILMPLNLLPILHFTLTFLHLRQVFQREPLGLQREPLFRFQRAHYPTTVYPSLAMVTFPSTMGLQRESLLSYIQVAVPVEMLVLTKMVQLTFDIYQSQEKTTISASIP